MKQPEIKAALILSLESGMDIPLARLSFRRSPKGLIYTRTEGDATWQFAMEFASNPSYASGSIAHVIPSLRISNPSITDLSLSLVEDAMLLANAPEVLQNHRLTMLQRPQLPGWYAADIGELDNAVTEALQIFIDQGISFLADYSNPAGIIRQFEAKDARVLLQRHQYVHVIAAYLLEGRPLDAMAIVHQQFSMPGIRKRYATLWKNVTSRSSATPP